MPLHKHESIREEMLDSVYAGQDLLSTLSSQLFRRADAQGGRFSGDQR